MIEATVGNVCGDNVKQGVYSEEAFSERCLDRIVYISRKVPRQKCGRRLQAF